jgi:hypothetical protein
LIKLIIHDQEEEFKKVEHTNEIIDISNDISSAPFLTSLSPSSVIEKIKGMAFKQNFQVCMLDKSGLWAKIKEYSF